MNSGFDKTRRLLSAGDYKYVFDGASVTLGNANFLLLARPSPRKHARLGLVIARKTLRRAVDRNRAKRVARETFRVHQDQLDCLDIVFLVRRGWPNLSSPEQFRLLDKGWGQLESKYRKMLLGKR